MELHMDNISTNSHANAAFDDEESNEKTTKIGNNLYPTSIRTIPHFSETNINNYHVDDPVQHSYRSGTYTLEDNSQKDRKTSKSNQCAKPCIIAALVMAVLLIAAIVIVAVCLALRE